MLPAEKNENVTTGYLVLGGYAGLRRHRVEIIGETRMRYRIRAIERTRLAGRRRWLPAGETTLVPKYAVRDNCVYCEGERGGVPGQEKQGKHGLICDYCRADPAKENVVMCDSK